MSFPDEWSERRGPAKGRPGDDRTPDQRDYARLIHSASFRRLQAKTQVLGIGEGDFHRTRLTHSMEAAQIASGVVRQLKSLRDTDDELREFLPGRTQLDTICLAHDLGHPPFGHYGEKALHTCMLSAGGFESNGQTLRILASLEAHTPNHGLNLTRRTLLGVLKYPIPMTKADSRVRDENRIPPEIQPGLIKPPKCFLDTEQDVVNWIIAPLSSSDRERFLQAETTSDTSKGDDFTVRTPSHHSLDTSIMNVADDIAYGVHDLEDAVSLGLISSDDWERYITEDLPSGTTGDPYDLGNLRDKLFSGNSSERKFAIGSLVNYFITHVCIEEDAHFDSPILAYRAAIKDDARPLLDELKHLILECVINSAEVKTLEHGGWHVIKRIFDALKMDPHLYLPNDFRGKLEDGESKPRVICDYIAGMTDSFANNVYERLYVPGSGTVFHKL